MVKKILLFIPLVLFFVIEWILDLVSKIVTVIHSGFKDVAIAIDKEYGTINNKREPDSGKV